jgi:hypothetical protein
MVPPDYFFLITLQNLTWRCWRHVPPDSWRGAKDATLQAPAMLDFIQALHGSAWLLIPEYYLKT